MPLGTTGGQKCIAQDNKWLKYGKEAVQVERQQV